MIDELRFWWKLFRSAPPPLQVLFVWCLVVLALWLASL